MRTISSASIATQGQEAVADPEIKIAKMDSRTHCKPVSGIESRYWRGLIVIGIWLTRPRAYSASCAIGSVVGKLA
jgi:hypothetical protein